MGLLTAVEVASPTTVELPGGLVRLVEPGDWIVTSHDQPYDVCKKEELALRYERVEPGLHLPAAVCREIEVIVGLQATQSPADLVRSLERLANIKIGGVKIEFTPGQLEEIKYRASKRGWTVQEELKRVIDRIKDEIFYKS